MGKRKEGLLWVVEKDDDSDDTPQIVAGTPDALRGALAGQSGAAQSGEQRTTSGIVLPGQGADRPERGTIFVANNMAQATREGGSGIVGARKLPKTAQQETLQRALENARRGVGAVQRGHESEE